MNIAPGELVVERVTAYDEQVAAGIGKLMHQLDSEFIPDPMPRAAMEEIIGSPNYDQLVAIHAGNVVGAATMTLILGAGIRRGPNGEEQQNRQGHLEDFVVDKSMRGMRVEGTDKSAADLLWDGMLEFCQGQRADRLSFDSETWRPDAWKFYAKHGGLPLEDTRHFELRVS